MRWVLSAMLSFGLAFGLVGPGSASQTMQPDFVISSVDGALWLVRDGQRHALVPQTVSFDELDRWAEGSAFGAQIPPIVLTASAADGPTNPGQPSLEWHRLARWQGNGDKNTEPFTIQGSQWRISYTVRDARSNTPRLCISVRTLETVHIDGGCYRQDDMTYIYRRGTFYLDITSADQWTATVEDYY